jgi:hypothetical protein
MLVIVQGILYFNNTSITLNYPNKKELISYTQETLKNILGYINQTQLCNVKFIHQNLTIISAKTPSLRTFGLFLEQSAEYLEASEKRSKITNTQEIEINLDGYTDF